MANKEAAVPQDPILSTSEETLKGSKDCQTTATQELDGAQQSPNWFENTEHTAGSAGADLAPEETAVTHICSSPDGDVGTENRSIAAPEESARTQDSPLQLENGQPTKSWFDPATSSTDGMNSSLSFSSPLPLFTKYSVEAGAPAASKRSLQDNSVSDISAVRKPCTKKKPKGRSARHPAPS